ncbi:MAG: type II toxin-antitoxin system RelE/ParE family toxin [Acidobacteriota bacterium]|nr:type II toxin-antitoxin system RelE/ParE family toxin [Acidobacteriota bacterium]
MTQIIRSAARDDIIRQFRYYLLDQKLPEVADRFVEAVQHAIQEIVRTPGMGAPKHLSNKSLNGLRSSQVQGFENIRVWYLSGHGPVQVIRVLHGKRDINRILESESVVDEPHG